MTGFSIPYRGYVIEPTHDPEADGTWPSCPIDQAEFFVIYPPDINEPTLNVEAYTLNDAMEAVNQALAAKPE